MKKKLGLVLFLSCLLTILAAPAASAHGEQAQEAFLRMRTIAWIDVQFSDNEVQQGDEITITGTAKLMNTWPDTLAAGEPRIGFINAIAPGPVVLMKERTINGVSAPGRIEIQKGDYYQFEMTIAARIPGRWHIHPAFAVKGAGTVLGPGEYITIRENPDGFENIVTLYNGTEINLENYGLSMVWSWQVLTFLIGGAWMLYWTVPKFHRTVTNLAVTSQIPLNDDGVEVGLNFKKDHRVVNIFFLVTALILLVGYLYQASAYPVKIPQQVVQFAPPTLPAEQEFASVKPIEADFNFGASELAIQMEVTNDGQSPMQLTQFATSTLNFVNPDSGESSEDAEGDVAVDPSGEIGPGETTEMTVTVANDIFATEHLIPVGEAQLTVAGVMIFENADGSRSITEIDVPIRPSFE